MIPPRTQLASPGPRRISHLKGEFNRARSQSWASRQGWEKRVCVCVWRDPLHSVPSPGVQENPSVAAASWAGTGRSRKPGTGSCPKTGPPSPPKGTGWPEVWLDLVACRFLALGKEQEQPHSGQPTLPRVRVLFLHIVLCFILLDNSVRWTLISPIHRQEPEGRAGEELSKVMQAWGWHPRC